MDKGIFIQEMIDKIRQIPISLVIQTRIPLPKRSGQHLLGLCPFHHDEHYGSFVVTDSKGIWKCFLCEDKAGDAIKFISIYDNVNYLKAAFNIALDFHLITQSEYESYFEKRRYSEVFVNSVERTYTEIDKKKFVSNIANKKDLNKVFRLFIKYGKLTEAHHRYLLGRGLSEQQILDGLYFSFPTRKMLPSFLNDIKKEYGNLEILDHIPGFYKKNDEYTFSFSKGIGFGIQNAFGYVVGIQIRMDEKKEGRNRYFWFSSSFAMASDTLSGGTASGSPADVVYPKNPKNRAVFITEGRFKAAAIAEQIGSTAFSVQGVSSWRVMLNELSILSRSKKASEIFGEGYKPKTIFVAFDADMNFNYQVFQQCKKMSDELVREGYHVYYLNWDVRFGKGIDDVLYSGNRNCIKKYDKQLWDKTYELLIECLLGEYDKIDEVPKEIFKNRFDEIFSLRVKPVESQHRR